MASFVIIDINIKYFISETLTCRRRGFRMFSRDS